MIELKNVAKTYRKGHAPAVKAIDRISLRIDQGEYVAILGASGSGKSSLMNVMGLLDRADEGRIVVYPPGSAFSSGTFGIWR